MGVTGLWRLIEPAGKPVPVETLENKVLAVDISIWLHQMVKGYQDAKGAPLPNAHLMGLFQRLCKLLYFRIKPVFVFDGGYPDLKKETIAKRQYNKAKYNSESERLKRELALILSKKTAISSLLGKDISPKKGHTPSANDDDLFKLPALPENQEETESDSEDEQNSSGSIVDLHSVDIESEKFKSLPTNEKYELLIELKETRKMNSWGRLHELPKKSDTFSDFQMQRLLKRRKVQECLEETGKEMGEGGLSLNQLESLLNEDGIDTKIETLPTRRIASSDTTRYLLINNVKQALADAKKKKELENNPGTSKEEVKTERQITEKDELEEDLEKAIKMSLECVDEQNTSSCVSKTDDSWTSVMSDSEYSYDSENEDGFEQPDMTSAKAYIMQYSDFTNKAIDKIVSTKTKPANKNKIYDVDEIIQEINKEKSVIVDNINLSSDEDSQTCNIECDSKKNKVQDLSTVTESNINSTQASVIYVENTVDNIISLDSSIGHILDQSHLYSIDETSIGEICTDKPSTTHEFNKNTLNSTDNNIKNNSEQTTLTNVKVESESSSSDEEFEEVPEIRSESSKTVVQLTLDMPQTCDEKDDIFADIFTGDISTTSVCAEKVGKNCDINFKEIKQEDKTFTETLISVSAMQDLCDNNKIKSVELVKEGETKAIQKSQDIANSSEIIQDSRNSGTIKDIVIDNSDNREEINNDMNKKKTATEVITTEKLNEMAQEMANEEDELMHEKGRLDRIGRNITEQMTKEAQELLQIFGIPYIVAPTEAEAQCAFLESVKLTDGTITDDSDIWLFGGKTVYKNFFNQKKHVLQYVSDRIERSFNLNREQLVLLALLVGSDYTTGVEGVGPVTAMEILASFPYNKKQLLNETSKHGRYQKIITGLQEFKRWVCAGKRTDNTSLKNKLRNITLSDEFPSVRVVQAYLEPNIEKSEDKFSWGELDITVLRDYTKAKFGWSQNKLDEIIQPVLKRIGERKSQKSMQDYFKRKIDFQSLEEHMSKRVKAAVQKLGPENVEEPITTESNEQIPAKQKKTAAKSGGKATKSKVKSTVLPGTSKANVKNDADCEINDPNIVMVSSLMSSKTGIDIVIPKTDRFQEIIPQREKEKQSLLQNKMKAIELFRKTKIDRKKKPTKRKVILPKDKAELSESSDSN